MGFTSSIFSMSVRAFSIYLILFTAISATEANPQFEKCWADFIDKQNGSDPYSSNDTSIIYQGLTYLHHVPNSTERKFIVSTGGCRTYCGSGVDYYPWKKVATTITTWVLPVIGILLQAPYEGNEFRRTLLALMRWIGSPIASLSYILWNIKVIGKCALLSDMSTPYDGTFTESELEDAEGAPDMLEMRDSLYILSVMNQYTAKSPSDPEQAETFLRIALFADIKTLAFDLKLQRKALAAKLREGRKRGIVPIFVSLMWFLVALAISIQGTFSNIGNNFSAHDLALGLLLAWFPVLILSSIVDRNPIQPTKTCEKLNKLLREVQLALRTDEGLEKLIQNFGGENTNDLAWVRRQNPPLASGFFNEFAGQGRVRWHYGVAHPILSGMEIIIRDKCESNHRRNWLKLRDIRKYLVRGPGTQPLLLNFDLREFWEVLSAFLIVIGTISGAFILSFRTPTIGLGCRAGGYAIFVIIAAGIFSLELLTWYFIVAPSKKGRIAEESRKPIQLIPTLNWTLSSCELVNTAWLIYIVMVQTIGGYRTCECQAATWGSGGGYIDAKLALQVDAAIVKPWWISGVLLSSLTMFAAMAFLIVEWCEQSHLNSVDLKKAMHGLKVTRHFKYRTIWVRNMSDHFIRRCMWLWRICNNSSPHESMQMEKGRKSITWST